MSLAKLNSSRIAHLNIISNYAGQFLVSVAGLFFVPLYISFMGMEAYGLVGFLGSIAGLTMILDLGLSSSVLRETARLSVLPGKEQQLSDLIKTSEYIYWGIGCLIGLTVSVSSPWLARHWIRPEHLSVSDVANAVLIMGLVLICRWPFTLYSRAMSGLQRQVLLNAIVGIAAILRGAGAILVLWIISPTIQAFLGWQLVSDLFQTLLLAFFLWIGIRHGSIRRRFSLDSLVPIWRFSAGIALSSILYTILVQMDKVLCSTLLPLKEFGYYTLASQGAAVLLFLAYPVQTALLPRLTQFAALDDCESLAKDYHLGCQLVTVTTLTSALVVAMFSKEITLAWTGSAEIAGATYGLLTILALGTGLNALLHMPSALQLAYGWTSISVAANAVALPIAFALLMFLSSSYGATGAAFVWLIVNAASVAIVVPITHARTLKGAQRKWLVNDVALPTLAAFCSIVPLRYLMPDDLSRPLILMYLAMVMCISVVAAAFAAPEARNRILAQLSLAQRLCRQ